jgi:hypothetical protein
MADNDETKQKAKPRGSTAVEFLSHLRPVGRVFVLTAIPAEGGATTTRTFTDLEEARQFIIRYNDRRYNIYYTSALCAAAMNSKPRKTDISAACYLHVDVDPGPSETPEQCKARMLAKIKDFQPAPTFIIDSGNGLQFLWELEAPVEITSQDVCGDIEARNRALARALGGDLSAFNIDRILRVPGTRNYPNKKKRELGRTECQAEYLSCNDVAHPLSAFPTHEDTASEDDAADRDESGSGYGFRFMADCKRRGLSYSAACEAILADTGKAGE